MSLLVSVTFAQNDSVATQGSDTGDVEVVISPKKGQDSTIVKVAGMKIIVLSDNDKGSDRVIVDGMEIDTEDWEDEDKDDDKDDPVSTGLGLELA